MKKLQKGLILLCFPILLSVSCSSNKIPDENGDDSSLQFDSPSENDSKNDELLEENEELESEPNENDIEDSEPSENDENSEPEDIEEPLVLDFFPDEDEVILIMDELPEEDSLEEQIDDYDEPEPVLEEPSAENSVFFTSELSKKDSLSQNNDRVTATDDIKTSGDITETTYINKIEDNKDLQAASFIEPLIEVSKTNTIEDVEEYEDIIVPSRKISLKEGEYIDITYPGIEWKFYGLTDNSSDIEFVDLKQNSTNTKITLLAKKAGNKILHFYKIDFLTDSYIDDFIEVEILASEKKENNEKMDVHKEVPKYSQVKSGIEKVKKENKPENEAISEEKKTEDKIIESDGNIKSEVIPQNTSNKEIEKITESSVTDNKKEEKKESSEVKQTFNAEDILKDAKKFYNSKNYKEALSKITEYLSISTDKRDEALYLEGQLYETQSNIRNIKSAINAYNTLINNYPASKFWNDANKRIIYLKRFYMEGR